MKSNPELRKSPFVVVSQIDPEFDGRRPSPDDEEDYYRRQFDRIENGEMTWMYSNLTSEGGYTAELIKGDSVIGGVLLEWETPEQVDVWLYAPNKDGVLWQTAYEVRPSLQEAVSRVEDHAKALDCEQPY